ncbi:hypothetical protein Cgig2_006709 [Carnegiea gigantea]|uniref:CCT domain-containing protein n=1 Tax=Carnegiea gigantea TaxID=171969 RepID=A0A9Q1Q6M6_9CARY|nr:hypothetical protein Cgig2_006709 [Carnegiea gigantea]
MQDDISSPINVQIFDFYNPDIFSETVQNNFDTNSSPNGCAFEDHSSSSYVANLSFPSITVENNHDNSDNKFNIESLDISNFLRDQNDHNSTSTASSTAATANTTANTTAATANPSPFQNGLSIIFDSQDDMDDISVSIDFSPSSPFSGSTPPYTINPITTTTTQQDQYQIPLNNGISPHPASIESTTLLPFISGPPPPLGPVFEEDYLPPILPFLRLNPANSSSPSCSSFLDHPSIGGSFLHGNLNHGLGLENSTVFSGRSLMGSELQPKELDFQGDSGGIFCPDRLPNEGSQLVSATTSSAPLATEITSVEDSSFKVGKLSTEQRKEKIHRYMKKRNERNFSKKIKVN